jgi:hypothetical protein
MANPVTYNQGTSIVGSLKSSVISVGVSPSLNISGYNWRNGFENNNIWVIYSDTYSQGQTTQGNAVPTIWGTPVFTDAGLLNLINVLPARAGLTAFTVLSDAIAWLYGENKYFLSNQNYPQIVTENLLGFWDAGFSASYPNVGTVWYNLSTGVNGTLTNGPSWNNSNTKSFFVFDGTDDYCSVGNLSSTNTNYVTVSTFVKRGSDGWNGALFGFGTQASETQDVYFWGGDANRPFGFNTWNGDSWGFNNSTASGQIMDGRWHHLVAVFDRNSITTNSKIYVDGVSKSLSQVRGATLNRTVSTNFGIGLNGWNTSDQLLNGNINSLFVYNKELDLSEILQNYYQGPIVTTNLSHLWDAGNLISYYTGSSTTYDMLNTGVNGTLQNGVGYSGNYGGYWLFDGTDDRILLSSSITLGNGDSNWTVNAWIRTTSLDDGLTANPILSNTNGGPIYGSFDTTQGYQTYWAYPSNINNWKKFQGNILVADGEWHMLTYVNKSNYTMDFYVDGVYDTTVSPTNVANNNPLDVIGGGLGTSFDGNIGMVQVNKGTAMNASQVSQQYGATRGRFQSYQAYANGGTVTTITENGTTYRVHTFTTSGTLSVVEGGVVEVLVVAGGGGGGVCYGGGGGAGGVKYDNSYDLTAGQSVTVTVGTGGTNQVNQVGNGGPGGNSVFGSITTTGGGYGGGVCGNQGGNGGSGGGGSGTGGSSIAGGNGVAGQGNNGNSSIFEGGGGGGGASSGGLSQNRQGGNGILFSINGTPTYYGGGGSGGGTTLLDGGLGGGGKGGIALASGVADATANTGGGGGGSIISGSGTSGLGGSGIVIVRYPIY